MSFLMLDNIIQWFMEYPSRIYTVIVYVMLFLYMELIIHIRIKATNRKDEKRNKRFVFCDGIKSRIVYIDMVTQDVFDNESEYPYYGIIDRNGTSVYFDLSRGHSRYCKE